MVLEAHTELPGSVLAPRDARHFVAGTMFDWGCPSWSPAAELIVTELVTNAVRHAPGPVGVDISLVNRTVRLAVSDSVAERPPAIRETPPGSVSGFGLQIVESLSSHWGWTTGFDRKTVWADMELDQATRV